MRLPKIAVKVKFLHPVWREYPLDHATPLSAGLDLRACIDQESLTIPPGKRLPFPAGLSIEVLEPGVAGFIYSRSGLGTKKGAVVTQGVGVVDPDYRGEIIVSLHNISAQGVTIHRAERIAQLLFQPVFQADIQAVDELSATSRGHGGFGHSGRI